MVAASALVVMHGANKKPALVVMHGGAHEPEFTQIRIQQWW
jgi:hypothetical protein